MNQIRSLFAQMNMANCDLSTTVPLALRLDQLLELSHQLKIDLEKLLSNRATLQKSPFVDSIKFTLTPAQIAYMMNQANFDIDTLKTVEHNLKHGGEEHQRFHLNSSQLAYLLANRRTIGMQNITGLSASQLLGLYVLQRQSVTDERKYSFLLTYEQIKQIALLQSNRFC